MSQRVTQINELIRTHLGEILTREVSLKPGVFVTITKVDVSRDLRHAKVSVSVFPEAEENYALKTLGKEKWNIQGKLNRKLYMKPMPALSFSFDGTESRAQEVEDIFKEIREETSAAEEE
jgi:ribosome-binding factor A